MGQVLFANGRVLPCAAEGETPFDGDVLIEGDRIAEVRPGRIAASADCKVIDLGGSTIMPGLGDAHVHFNQPLDFEMDFAALMAAPEDDAALASAAVARQYIESGVTTCVSAGVSRARGDVAIKSVIDRGWAVGPRLIPGGQMISAPEGIPALFVPTTTEAMREIIAEQCDLGVQVIKLFLSGENVMPAGSPPYPADRTYMKEELVDAAVDEAGRRGAFIHVHARSASSVTMAARCGVRLISHASYVDDEGLTLLQKRDDVWVCPSAHYMLAMATQAPEPYARMAREGGYLKEFEDALATAARLVDADVPIVPGGDYGHVWVPHGDAAHDLEHFVDRAGVSPQQAVLMGTRSFGPLTGLPVGQITAGYLADMVVLDGDPTSDITVLQDRSQRRAVVKGGELAWVNPDRVDRL
jgi:imidazolonepropionase-like amidohydrolase